MANDMAHVTEVLAKQFDLIPPGQEAEYNRARKYWEPITTTQSGKFAAIDDAKNGDKRALAYLFWVVSQDGRIEKNLKWSFLGPNATAQKNRITHGDDLHVYRSLVMEALFKALKNWKNPDPSIDYFISLRNFTVNHVVSYTKNYNKEQNRGGMSGKVMAGEQEPQVGSYETFIGADKPESGRVEKPSDSKGSGLATHHDPFKDSEDLDAWQTFVDDEALDKGPAPTTRAVLKYFLTHIDNGFDAKAAGESFGKTHVTIYGKLKSMKDILETHGINDKAFLNLLQTHGAQSLSETL